MTLASNQEIFQMAEKKCSQLGVRFTKQRQEVFKILLTIKRALSAYEITEELKATEITAIPVMSVYRALDFLQEHKLVHKITAINKYSVCTHITCNHEHQLPRLAVCMKCQVVDEMPSNHTVRDDLQSELKQIGFQLQSQQLELVGICSHCS